MPVAQARGGNICVRRYGCYTKAVYTREKLQLYGGVGQVQNRSKRGM